MSQSIGIITPISRTLEIMENVLGHRWEVEKIHRQNGGVDLHIEITNDDIKSYVSISCLKKNFALSNYIESDDLPQEFRDILVNSSFYLLSFNDLPLVKSVVVDLLSDKEIGVEDIWIDDDYGRIIRAKNFISNIVIFPDWDWRNGAEH